MGVSVYKRWEEYRRLKSICGKINSGPHLSWTFLFLLCSMFLSNRHTLTFRLSLSPYLSNNHERGACIMHECGRGEEIDRLSVCVFVSENTCWAVQCDLSVVDFNSKSPLRQVRGLHWFLRYIRVVWAQWQLWFTLYVHWHITNLCLCLDVCGAIYSSNLYSPFKFSKKKKVLKNKLQ